MADHVIDKAMRPRPLSPHLGIYRFTITMAMSILHRITGAALYLGVLLVAWWLIALAQGPAWSNTVTLVLGHPLGQVVLVGFTWAMLHHLLGGLRHFIWDTGRGFDLPRADSLAWLSIIGSLVLTVLIWLPRLHLQGWF